VLLEADVNFQLTREFLERVEKKAVGVTQLKTVQPAQQLVKIVYDELTTMLGERREPLKLSVRPADGRHDGRAAGVGQDDHPRPSWRASSRAEGRPTRLVAADVYRPAAIDQLETLGAKRSTSPSTPIAPRRTW
jgi:signal recognition particle subunit SRP54